MPAWGLYFVCDDFLPLPDVMNSVLHDFDTLSITYVLNSVTQTDIRHLWNRQAAQTREIGKETLRENPFQSQFLFENQHMYVSPYSTIQTLLN